MILIQTSQNAAAPKVAENIWKSSDKDGHMATSATETSEGETLLGSSFSPGHFDVICARGKEAWNHPGNIHFRSLVEKTVERYEQTTSRCHRTAIVTEIVESIRRKGNGFVKQENNGEWIEVSSVLAREKVEQMMRNALSCTYKSSFTNKKRRRRAMHFRKAESLHKVVQSNRKVEQSMKTLKETTENLAEKKLSDDEILKVFNQNTSQMLGFLKSDRNLVKRFHDAEVEAESGSSSDEDVDASGGF